MKRVSDVFWWNFRLFLRVKACGDADEGRYECELVVLDIDVGFRCSLFRLTATWCYLWHPVCFFMKMSPCDTKRDGALFSSWHCLAQVEFRDAKLLHLDQTEHYTDRRPINFTVSSKL